MSCGWNYQSKRLCRGITSLSFFFFLPFYILTKWMELSVSPLLGQDVNISTSWRSACHNDCIAAWSLCIMKCHFSITTSTIQIVALFYCIPWQQTFYSTLDWKVRAANCSKLPNLWYLTYCPLIVIYWHYNHGKNVAFKNVSTINLRS